MGRNYLMKRRRLREAMGQEALRRRMRLGMLAAAGLGALILAVAFAVTQALAS